MFSLRGKIFGSYAIRKVEMTFHDARQHLDLTSLHRQHPVLHLALVLMVDVSWPETEAVFCSWDSRCGNTHHRGTRIRSGFYLGFERVKVPMLLIVNFQLLVTTIKEKKMKFTISILSIDSRNYTMYRRWPSYH